MKCPNCAHEYDAGSYCPKCKLDAVLYTGTLRVSDILYNKGLAKTKANDLSGAVECLTKSVEINKHNLHARNLLGLTLFEMGRIGEALTHWVISNSLVKEDNPASAYIEDVQKNGRFLERLNDAARMYNRALDDIKQKSDDMAIIQLKKALEINPKFIDAMNLLTLCYLIQRDREKAANMVERVLAMDVNNTVALSYYNELYGGRSPLPRAKKAAMPASSVSSAAASSPYQRVTVREKKSTNFHIAEILSFIIGAACMFAALYVLWVPAINRENEKRIEEYQSKLNNNEINYRAQLDEKEAEINEGNNRIIEMEAKIDEWAARYDTQERTNRVLNAYGMLTDNKYQDAVDVIDGINTDGLASDIVEKAADIYTIAYPKLSQEYYDQGVKAYTKDKDYDKARVDFEKAFRYTAEDANTMPDLLYYLGFTYAMSDESAEDAVELLSILVENYPNYKRIKEVKQKLTSLEG